MDLLLKLCCFAMCFLIACFLLYYFVYFRRTIQWKNCNIPFLQPLFLIGHKYVLDTAKNMLVVSMDRIYLENKDKDVLAFFIALCPWILIKDPKLMKQIFVKNSDKTFVTAYLLPKDDVDTQSVILVASDKEQWKKGHLAMAPLFTTSRMDKAAFDLFKRQIGKLNDFVKVRRLARQPISVETITFNFFADNMCFWHFAEDNNSYEKSNELNDAVHSFFNFPLAKMICCFLLLICPSAYALRHVITGFQAVEKKYVDFMRSLLRRKIEFRKKYGVKRNDVIDHFMYLKEKYALMEKKDGADTILGSKEEVNLRQMTGYALTLLLAGVDTVAQLSLSVIHLLSLHPEYQDRIKREIDDVMKKHKVSELTLEVIQDLRLTEQCVYESVRLIPLVSVILRRCSEDFQIPGTNYAFKKGDMLIALPYSIHHDPEYYKDPHTFYPERFDLDNRNTTSWQYLLAFGIGARKCPGYKLGVLQAVIFVASIVCKYEIRPRSHLTQMTAEDYHPRGSTFRPKRELLVDLIPR